MKFRLINPEYNEEVGGEKVSRMYNAKNSLSAAKKIHMQFKHIDIIHIENTENGKTYSYDTKTLSFEKRNHRNR
jgi:hypothetical protein